MRRGQNKDNAKQFIIFQLDKNEISIQKNNVRPYFLFGLLIRNFHDRCSINIVRPDHIFCLISFASEKTQLS